MLRTRSRVGKNASSPTLRPPTLLCGLAVLVLAPLTVMAQRFDVMTFEAPSGWTQQALGDGLMFEKLFGPGVFCQIFLRESYESTAPLLQELDLVWSDMRQVQPLVAAPGDPGQLDLPNGFKVAQRVGMAYGIITALNLLQKGDRLVPVVVNASDYDTVQRCGPAMDNLVASLRLDETSAAPGSAMTGAGGANLPGSAVPTRSDPQLAARFGNSVVGTWRYALTTVNWGVAPTQLRNVIQIQFAPDGTYTLLVDVSMNYTYRDDETGAYQVQGQRILMRPANKGPYSLDWYFGDHPDYVGNWGLILRSDSEWLGSFTAAPGRWRTFKPAE